jgi:predicted RNase H-like HicB family nuclease
MKEYYMVIDQDQAGWYVGSNPELPGHARAYNR